MRGSKGLWMGLLVAGILSFTTEKADAIDRFEEESFVTYIEQAVTKDDLGFIYLNNGRVLRLEKAADISEFSRFSKHQALSIRVIDRGEVDELIDVRFVDQPAGYIDAFRSEQDSAFDIDSQAIDPTPTGVFNYMKAMGFRRGECFHRAYLWAYDTWTKEKIATHKTFLFFTRKYIERYRYKWWFHVAPMLISDGVEWMLDPRFVSAPRSVKRWTDNFMKNAAECPVITKYEGYERHHKDKWCYLRKTTMFYYHPNSVLRADGAGRTETQFDENGLYFSRKALGRLIHERSLE